MPTFREGEVVSVDPERHGMVALRVVVDAREIPSVAFPRMSGPVGVGDRVVVNTTGIDLGLGTGGVGFVLWNLDGRGPQDLGDGHIMKLRYTPWQTDVLAVEAPESPHHDAMADLTSIDGMPVVVCSLHSQIAGVAAGYKARRPSSRLGYLMTDGACLPLSWSDLVGELRAAGLVDVTCTAGHAFGGDLEAVNVFGGLAALREVEGCDAAIVSMGPGVVGTGTILGSTALEQGQVLDAVVGLGGAPIACLRINFSDPRPRHHGVSSHSIAALTVGVRSRCEVALPRLPPRRFEEVRRRLDETGVSERHDLVEADAEPALERLRDAGIAPASMGRPLEAIPELFLAAGAAGIVAAGK